MTDDGAGRPTFPELSHHVAIAGMNGSGKTTAAIDMLSKRLQIPWLLIDHKEDDSLAKLPREKIKLKPLALPDQPGLYHVVPPWTPDGRQQTEELLQRIFQRNGSRPTRFGVYVDEGHLMGKSPMVEKIMVAGRSKVMPMMWVSQRASGIDPFIWGQARYYRAFRLQTLNDRKRFNENFPDSYVDPEPYHSHYFDGVQGEQFYLAPSDNLQASINRIDAQFTRSYSML